MSPVPPPGTPAGHRQAQRKALTRRRFLATTLALLAGAAAAAITAGYLGVGVPPTYQQAPAVEKPFTPADPDTYTGGDTPPVLGPMEVAVPSLNIRAVLVDVGLKTGTNNIVIPSAEKVGHYTPAAPIGAATGTTLLAGHVNKGLAPGALWNLSKAQKGALVYITDQVGKQFTYKITSSRTIMRQPLPADTYKIEGTPQLVLVTCAGTPGPDGEVLNYDQNTIVAATPLTVGGPP
ncbi:class F sortase [Paenarthrobacter sp. NPDC056912]|uniref:class F sortase n=1 Tax=Paenarthrobacter sp. NPDC056912 TaxID=3345965 RepID=UPI00366C8A0F